MSRMEGVDTTAFMESLYEANDTRTAIGQVLDRLDDLQLAGDFAACDDAFRLADPSRLAPPIIVSMLGITLRAGHQGELPSRDEFWQRAMVEVGRLKGPRYARQLLAKYR